MLWALVLMQEVLCAQEEEAPPKKKEDTPMIRSLRNPLGSHQVLISGRSYGKPAGKTLKARPGSC
jgi:hypothetical protein